MIVNLIWLPSAIQEIRDKPTRTAAHVNPVWSVSRSSNNSKKIEGDLRITAVRMRPYFFDGDREQLRLIAQRLCKATRSLTKLVFLTMKEKNL